MKSLGLTPRQSTILALLQIGPRSPADHTFAQKGWPAVMVQEDLEVLVHLGHATHVAVDGRDRLYIATRE